MSIINFSTSKIINSLIIHFLNLCMIYIRHFNLCMHICIIHIYTVYTYM